MNDHLSIARQAMSAPWDAARSDRVFQAAVRARGSRARRQRWMMVAATAAVFVFALKSFGAPSLHATSTPVSALSAAGADDDLGMQSAGAVAMSSVADGGRETD